MLFRSAAPAPEPPPPVEAADGDAAGDRAPTIVAGSTAELVEQAQAAFEDALARQRAGDWAGYGEAIDRLGAILAELESSTE